ncbi:NDR1/HIN1-like protein 13 [Rutidosis leptorrhynchoides]|uniref:NDR1/HIN1-like protein 13 n=1 Tax=Rutidosis leptorrhynchoides TaxID=125765 RepID=UPI003A99775E
MAGDTSYTPSKPTTTTTVKQPQQPPPPPNKSNPNLNRHPYRPNPIYNRHNTNRRSYFCIFCFWLILIIILILFLATITGCILYLMYRPHRPIFTISSLKISQFNLTTTSDDTSHLSTNFNLTLSTKNTNKKVVFYYDPFAITCVTVDTQIANGSVTDSLASGPNNITIIRSALYSSSMLLDTTTVNQIRSDLKKKSGLRLKIILDTEARVKIESIKSKKVGIRIECEGIHSLIPKGVTAAVAGGKSNRTTAAAPVAVAANVVDAKCIVDLRIKIWKWTFSS